MKFIKEYLEEALKLKPLGEVTLVKNDFYSNVIINGVDTGISVAHIDYSNWLDEKIVSLPCEDNSNHNYRTSYDPWGID